MCLHTTGIPPFCALLRLLRVTTVSHSGNLFFFKTKWHSRIGDVANFQQSIFSASFHIALFSILEIISHSLNAVLVDFFLVCFFALCFLGFICRSPTSTSSTSTGGVTRTSASDASIAHKRTVPVFFKPHFETHLLDAFASW